MPSAEASEQVGIITLYFPLKGGGYGRVKLRWVEGKNVHGYLTDPSLITYHLIGLRSRCRLHDQRAQPLRLTSVPRVSDTVILERAR